MNEEFSREIRIIGDASFARLSESSVVLFGVGGVGSYTAESLARAGIGTLTLIDSDVVDISNINRQLIALHSTIGRSKVEVAAERIHDINPLCQVNALRQFMTADNVASVLEPISPDYVVDAIDNVTAKLAIASYCCQHNIPLISAMGTGNKLDPARFEITDISNTSVCPLCKVMRKECKNRGISHLTVLYSREEPQIRCTPPGSISFVPSVAGLMIGGHVIRSLCQTP